LYDTSQIIVAIIVAIFSFISGYVLSRIQNKVDQQRKISKELYIPLHSEISSIGRSIRHCLTVDTISYGITGWEHFKQLGTISLIEKRLLSMLEQFYSDVRLYNSKLRDAKISAISIIKTYVSQHFETRADTNLDRALEYVPNQIFIDYIIDLLGEPLLSESDLLLQKQQILNDLHAYNDYGVSLSKNFLEEIADGLARDLVFADFHGFRNRMLETTFQITKKLENEIRKHGI
jgi:hypothetical protein